MKSFPLVVVSLVAVQMRTEPASGYLDGSDGVLLWSRGLNIERERKFGIERFAKDVLSVADNLGRALAVLPDGTDVLDPALRNVILGVQATDRELQSVLERHGVKRVESLGTPFNPEFHQAMMEVEDPTVPSGTVVQEHVPGYLIAGRLLRPAMVVVSKGGPAGAKASNENKAE